VEYAFRKDPYMTRCHGSRCILNCRCRVCWWRAGCGGAGSWSSSGGIGSLTCPSIESMGVIGGPSNTSVVGTVGENFSMVLLL